MNDVLTTQQLNILKNIGFTHINEQQLVAIAKQEISISLITIDQLVEFLRLTNFLYRSGYAIISDDEYDNIFRKALIERQPDHEFLHAVEPEFLQLAKTLNLPEKMLSTDKAYSKQDIEKWLNRLIKAASEIELEANDIVIKITPKLDGYAAYDDGSILYTRGDGNKGADITRVLERGLLIAGSAKRGLGPGEIVIRKSYFDEYLSNDFENARNFQAAILAEKKVDEQVIKALKSGAACFYPFSELPKLHRTIDELLSEFDSIGKKILQDIDYDVDGIILETTNQPLKQHMGATRHHHRWQIALKENTEKASVKVIQVIPQTSRTGRINPVVELQPTKLSGATISRVTAHHYGMVKDKGIGSGALIELVRSGLVIPKIEQVIKSGDAQIPTSCPSCNTLLLWDKDYLFCPNTTSCPEQIENTIEHFFKCLKNNDGFGKKTIEKLHMEGIASIFEIYELTSEEFMSMGFGEKTTENLINQLRRSRIEPIEDWRFLQAFGVVRLGGGNSERILQHHPIETIFDISEDDLIHIDGFAVTSAKAIISGLSSIKGEFLKLFELGFNLERTRLTEGQDGQTSPILGKVLVFTGTMLQGKRSDMQASAKKLGAKIGTSVTNNTDYLITGEKVGKNKINDAQKKNVKILSEEEYLQLLSSENSHD